MERWRGKTAVVTGAGGGIGSAIMDNLAREGLKVVGLDVNVDSKVPSKQVLMKCDITDLPELARTFKTIEDQYGGVDVMINCAGYSKCGTITSVGNQISDADIAKTMDVNIKAMIFCSRHAVNSMKKRGFDGHIVNFCSIAGHYVAFTDQFNVYSSSKYAVNVFTQSLFHELAHSTSISPGLVKTPMSTASVKDFTGLAFLEPSDIADAVAYALSTPPHVNITELTVQPVGDLRM